jgi:hypothetical protein
LLWMELLVSLVMVNLTSAKLHGKVEKPVDESEKLKIQGITWAADTFLR